MKVNIKSLVTHGLLIGALAFLFSLIISLLAAEFIIKNLYPQRTHKIAKAESVQIFAEDANIPFTLKKDAKNIPHIGYTHEFFNSISTNSQGTRGADFTVEKKDKTFRILILGDSMTFGWGVEDNQTFTYFTEQYLNELAAKNNFDTKFEVINAGFADAKTLDTYYVYLKNTGLTFQPDLIIVNFFPYNDISDLTEMTWTETDNQGLPQKVFSNREKVKDGHLASRAKTEWKYEIPVLRNWHMAILFFNAMEKGSPDLVQKIKDKLGIVNDDFSNKSTESWECLKLMKPKLCPKYTLDEYSKSQTLIKGLSELAQNNQKQFLLTIMAAPIQALPLSREAGRKDSLPVAEPQRSIRAFLEEQKIDYFDLLETLSTPSSKNFFYERDGHLTSKGTQQVGASLAVYIAQKYFPNLAIDNLFYENFIDKPGN